MFIQLKYIKPQLHFLMCTVFVLLSSYIFAEENDTIIVDATNKSCAMSVKKIYRRIDNDGFLTSFDQVLRGKLAGVRVGSLGGSPMSGSNIDIRNVSSYFSAGKPLIVLDGVPLENNVSWSVFSSQISLNDIESIKVLKDAVEAVIYGLNANNGVIEIVTKKGNKEKLNINFRTVNAVQQASRSADVLSHSQFRQHIIESGSAEQIGLLGNSTTNWADEIYQNALATDNHLSVSGSFLQSIPFYASVNYLNQDGILKTDNVNKLTGNLRLTPTLWNEYLKLDINLRVGQIDNRVANQKAISVAMAIDPTQPVKSSEVWYMDNFDGYWQSSYINNGHIYPNFLAPKNPVGLLYQENNTLKSLDSHIHINVDYKLHFFPDIHFTMLLGYTSRDITNNVIISDKSSNYYQSGLIKKNNLVNTNAIGRYNLIYDKTFDKHGLYVKVGCESVKQTNSYYGYHKSFDGPCTDSTAWSSKVQHIAIFSSLKYIYDEKLSFALDSRKEANNMPAIYNRVVNSTVGSFSWNALKTSQGAFNKLWAFVNYGVFGYERNFQSYVNTDASIIISRQKPETTKHLSYGINFEMNRFTGNINFYNKELINMRDWINVPNGTNFNTYQLATIGSIKSKGAELQITYVPVVTQDLYWSIDFDADYQNKTVADLSVNSYYKYDKSGLNMLINKNNAAPNSFYVLKQKYSADGKPIEGEYEDVNADGLIDYQDYVLYHSPEPLVTLGLNSFLNYKKWGFGFSLRAIVGNYIYNVLNADMDFSTQYTNLGFLHNLSTDYLYTKFSTPQSRSSYYVEDASFLKMDNVFFAYNFGEIIKDVNLKATLNIQNVFTITKYKGTDPEVQGGIDWGYYQHPRIFSIGLKLEI